MFYFTCNHGLRDRKFYNYFKRIDATDESNGSNTIRISRTAQPGRRRREREARNGDLRAGKATTG